mmetsp:Transcript_81227/g.175540  ORF Transcript_81227/g.175540 Transcript_81227/m.175540 type:complete len:201 (+) Transcript_81227:370-972(+)
MSTSSSSSGRRRAVSRSSCASASRSLRRAAARRRRVCCLSLPPWSMARATGPAGVSRGRTTGRLRSSPSSSLSSSSSSERAGDFSSSSSSSSSSSFGRLLPGPPWRRSAFLFSSASRFLRVRTCSLVSCTFPPAEAMRFSPVALAAAMGMSVFTGSTRDSGMPPLSVKFDLCDTMVGMSSEGALMMIGLGGLPRKKMAVS